MLLTTPGDCYGGLQVPADFVIFRGLEPHKPLEDVTLEGPDGRIWSVDFGQLEASSMSRKLGGKAWSSFWSTYELKSKDVFCLKAECLSSLRIQIFRQSLDSSEWENWYTPILSQTILFSNAVVMAGKIRTRRPSFATIISEDTIDKLDVPRAFVLDELNGEEGAINLIGPGGERKEGFLDISGGNTRSSKVFISGQGWENFAQENKLSDRHLVIAELVSKRTLQFVFRKSNYATNVTKIEKSTDRVRIGKRRLGFLNSSRVLERENLSKNPKSSEQKLGETNIGDRPIRQSGRQRKSILERLSKEGFELSFPKGDKGGRER